MKALQLDIDDDFYNEEWRCEFFVTQKMKKIWAVELDLLSELLKVCEKHNIRVYAFAGTLLGAVRHQGFIPWDDDMDVCLTRSDYEKLLSVAPKEFKHPYFFQTALTDRTFFCGYARLRNSNTTGLIAWNDSLNYNNGIYIDIFVLDGYVSDQEKLKVQLNDRRRVERAIRLYNGHVNKRNTLKKWAGLTAGWFFRKITTYEKLVDKYQKIIMRYNETTDSVTLLTHNIDFANKYWCKKSDLAEVKFVPFEFIQIPVPGKHDEMLTHMYGDYMKFPPVEKRGLWHEGSLIFDPDVPYKDFMAKRSCSKEPRE